MDYTQDIILLFTKYPEAGKSKTRLIPSLGQQGAARLQRVMTLSVTATLQRLAHKHHCHLEIHHEGGNLKLMQEWLGASHHFITQHHGDLGQRMACAIATHLGRYHSIILLGSDCPDMNTAILEDALYCLQDHDMVIGPAFDGGYYLIGVRGVISRDSLHFLFSDIDWGGEQVLHQTLARIKKLQLRCHLLKRLHDIDTPADLHHLNNHSNTQ